MAPDPYDLTRFVEAQNAKWPQVVAELSAGRKQSHWSWYVFPQIEGLSRSAMGHAYAIDTLEEARAYRAHPTLGPRLLEIAALMGRHEIPAADILGTTDALKLRSCLTLFEAVAQPGDPFAALLERFFEGERCPITRAWLTERV
ncbi:MAG: DUF1810 domain-containing protein [Pseudomonadota bacterium]